MDIRELENLINQLPHKIERAIERAVEISALKIEDNLTTIFKTEGTSHNVDWSPLKEAYLKWKIKKGFSEKKLHKTTTLAQSFTSKVEGMQAIVGTPVEYAIYHELGTRKMPARPFMYPVFKSFIEKKGLEKAFKIAFEEVLR